MNRKEEYRRKFRNCEQNFKEKLFLASFDLMSLNYEITRLLYQLYMVLDFLFLVSYPLEQIFGRSKSAEEDHSTYTASQTMHKIALYINPADRLYEILGYENNKKVLLIVIIYAFLVLAALLAQIFSRNKKKLYITSQTKFYNKVLGLTMCFKDQHLALVCFAILAIFIFVSLSLFTLSMMTSCYPNETVPWAHSKFTNNYDI